MSIHQATVTPVKGKDGTTQYSVAINSNTSIDIKLFATLESALDSFDPPLSTRVRSHVVEGVRGEGKPVVFCLEDAIHEP
jgi:hypothetical protein